MDFKYAKLTGRLGVMLGDSPDDTGEEPDVVYCDEGQVLITPAVSQEQVNGLILGPQPIQAIIDGNGYLSINGVRQVYVLDLGDTNLRTYIPRDQGAWQITFKNVKYKGTTVNIPAFWCNPNADDNDADSGFIDGSGNPVQKNDLSILSPIPSAGSSVGIVVGPQGPPGETGGIQSIVAGTDNVTVDSTDPANPVISVSGTGGTPGGTGDQLLSSDTTAEAWGVLGVVPTSNLPALAINDTFTIADQAARLALTAQRGDTAFQTDTSTWYILAADDATTDSNWKAISVPAVVQSVNGQVGVVNLAAADVGAATPADVDQVSAILNTKADLVGSHVPIEQAPANDIIAVVSTTSWPPRPTSRTDVFVIWLDLGGLGTKPAGAIDGDQVVAVAA